MDFGIRVAIPSDSNGAVSIIVDNVTVPVKLSDGSAITDFKAGGVYNLTYYNGNFICASGGSNPTIDTVTFTSDKLLTGYTANDSNGKAVSGTMTMNGAGITTLESGDIYPIAKGYHTGNGTVIVKSLTDQTVGTATKNDIAYGKTAWVNGVQIDGAMTDVKDLRKEITTSYGSDMTVSGLGTADITVGVLNPFYESSKKILRAFYYSYGYFVLTNSDGSTQNLDNSEIYGELTETDIFNTEYLTNILSFYSSGKPTKVSTSNINVAFICIYDY